jgi:hypothetical protein
MFRAAQQLHGARTQRAPHSIALGFRFGIFLNFVAKPAGQFLSQRMRNTGAQPVIDLLSGKGQRGLSFLMESPMPKTAN